MLSTNDRIEHDLVFAGAGHANMLALRMLGMVSPARTRLTLVSSTSDAAYSGMVPGYVAGVYEREEICINLPAFCARLGITFVRGNIIGLESKTNQLHLENRPPIGFDVLHSIWVLATPA
jgi:NADH dehydrogenase, FAD-containing subunit